MRACPADRKSNRMSTSMAQGFGIPSLHTGSAWMLRMVCITHRQKAKQQVIFQMMGFDPFSL